MTATLLDDVRLVVRGWRWTRRQIPPTLSPDVGAAPSGPPVFDTRWARSPFVRALRDLSQAAALPVMLHGTVELSVGGTDQLPHVAPPVILVANHISHLDTLLVLHALPTTWQQRTVVAAAADYFFSSRWRAALAAAMFNAVPVDRRSGDTAQRTLSELLERGWHVLTFPEGTRSRDGSLKRFHHGAARLALDFGVPLVPVGVRGTFRAMPAGARWPMRTAVSVRFGRALMPRPGERVSDLTVRLRQAVAAVLEEDATTWWNALRHPPEAVRATAHWRTVWQATRPIARPRRPPIWRETRQE
jgi:1-acyl-sn-glycerol-3-phosphate acyltransferase